MLSNPVIKTFGMGNTVTETKSCSDMLQKIHADYPVGTFHNVLTTCEAVATVTIKVIGRDKISFQHRLWPQASSLIEEETFKFR